MPTTPEHLTKQPAANIADMIFAIEYAPVSTGKECACNGCFQLNGGVTPDVRLSVAYGGIPEINLPQDELVFASDPVWYLYKTGGENVIVLYSPATGASPYKLARFNSDFSRGEIFHRQNFAGKEGDVSIHSIVGYPLMEILLVCLTALNRGVFVHACGIDDGGRGYLFAGNSGHGKSTMARLWSKKARVLNDDRIIIRKKEGRFWIYGLPWHGEFNQFSLEKKPLDRLFFLQKSSLNKSACLDHAQAAAMLLARSFPPLWDSAGMLFTLDFISELIEAVPCQELQFTPDESVLDFVRSE